MKRDPASLLFTALAVVSLSIPIVTGRPEPRAKADDGGRGGKAPEGRARQRPSGASAGNDAATPSEIPTRGWWAIAKRVAGKVSENRLMTEAAGITFYALLALFPALAALVSIYGAIRRPGRNFGPAH